MIDIQLGDINKRPLPLEQLRKVPALQKMELLRKGSRLSVQPVTKDEFAAVLKLAELTGERSA
ncbi:MAG: EVE domain-containing protein [Planctomycetales bacterium]|nr:EVE domain-containing protein [Planctomycetales bacterium]